MINATKLHEVPRNAPTVSTMTVTPAMAQDWITKNTAKNRRVLDNLVMKYAEDIRADRWQLNGSTIVMSTSGAIIDGQHRLLAIIEAGRAVVTMVASGVDDEAFETIDSGRPRTPSDILSIMGYEHYRDQAQLGRLNVLQNKYGSVIVRGRAVQATTQEIVEQVNLHTEEYEKAIHDTSNLRYMFGNGALWQWYYIRLGMIDVSDRDFFFDRLRDGQGLSDDDPIYALRQAMLNARLLHRSMTFEWVGGMLIKSWNRYRNHERAKTLVFQAVEKYPEPV